MSILGGTAVVALYPTYLKAILFLRESYGLTDQKIFVFLTTTVCVSIYFFVNIFFMAFLHIERSTSWRMKRMPLEEPFRPATQRQLVEAIVGLFVFLPIFTYYLHPVCVFFGMPGLSAPLPSFQKIVLGLALARFGKELSFYWIHRFQHHPAFFKITHEDHHKDFREAGIGVEYGRPIERLQTHAGCVLLGCHGSPLIFLVWLSIRLLEVNEGHCGLCFYGTFLHLFSLTHADLSAFHNFHHGTLCGNFGVPWTDYVFGTMDAWVELGGSDKYIEHSERNVVKKRCSVQFIRK
jgi:sterol desaturase/sphingolipid hydroxylase (fatty acid hydroxylase superfamily)